MHVLDESLHALADFLLPHFLTLSFSANDLISREGFSEHGDKGAVPRKKNGVCRLVHLAATRRNVQPDQRLPRSRHARDEASVSKPRKRRDR